jgi:amino-acid N-acetyltransferase
LELNQLSVEAARATDDALVRGLLTTAGLPLDGLSDQFPSAYVVAFDRGVVVGAAGLETYGDVGLLRSVAVSEAVRSRGLGRRLVENRLAQARLEGLGRVFLLTTTAAPYFERLGFLRTDRNEAPAALSESPEFAFACPASAACLVFAF